MRIATSAFARSSRRPVQVANRHVSSKPPKYSASLPPAKMHALISLYHQSESFITPENLSARIDETFLREESLVAIGSPNIIVQDLSRLVRRRRATPRLGVWEDDSHGPASRMAYGWTGDPAFREQCVFEALYGVDSGKRPGLAILEESGEKIQEDIEDDLDFRDREPKT